MKKYLVKGDLKKKIINYTEVPKGKIKIPSIWKNYKVIHAKSDKDLFRRIFKSKWNI